MSSTIDDIRSAPWVDGSADSADPAGARRAARERWVARAREIGELAWSRRAETDRDRRLPDELVETLRASGLVKLCRHRRWGGAEAEPVALLDVGRELARGSAALGWVFSLLAFHDWYMSFATDEFQSDVWGADPDAFVCASLAPMGQAERVPGGYRLSGRWRFASGVEWSSWIGLGGVVPAPGADRPELHLLFVPRSEVTVVDDWHTLGLRGSASRSVDLEQVFVPEHRILALKAVADNSSRGPVADDGPLWRVPLMTMQGMSVMTPSIGVAQRALEEFTDWTRQRLRPYENNAAQRENPAAQLTLASTATQWDATWALARAYTEDGWERGVRGQWLLSEQERARLFSWRAYVARSCVDLTDTLYTSSGAMTLFDGHPLQQVFRDIHTAGVHIGTDRGDAYTSRGRVAMGFPGHPFH